LTYMMLDADVVAVSASSVYRVLKGAGLLGRFRGKPSSKGKGFHQPSRPHRHWHVDIAYVNICGTFYFMTSILDGYSRYIVHSEIREKMEEIDIEAIVQRAREKFPAENPRIITDNGPQFISKDFKQFIRICGMTHVRTSPYYPQSNGKLERYHTAPSSQSASGRRRPCRWRTPGGSWKDSSRGTNNERLHSALGYITPRDKLHGREMEIFAARDRKLEEARRQRQQRRRERPHATHRVPCYTEPAWAEDRATQRCDPSADPGPEARGGGAPAGAVAPFPLASGAMR
jgi:putative transposase